MLGADSSSLPGQRPVPIAAPGPPSLQALQPFNAAGQAQPATLMLPSSGFSTSICRSWQRGWKPTECCWTGSTAAMLSLHKRKQGMTPTVADACGRLRPSLLLALTLRPWQDVAVLYWKLRPPGTAPQKSGHSLQLCQSCGCPEACGGLDAKVTKPPGRQQSQSVEQGKGFPWMKCDTLIAKAAASQTWRRRRRRTSAHFAAWDTLSASALCS